ncbi:putative SGNH hydrolase-type esterase domain-containing protein [uncultured Gammaproteobacteria bacterium]
MLIAGSPWDVLRSFLVNAALVVGAVLVTLGLTEAALHLWHPWQTTVRSDKIVLPVNRVIRYHNDHIRGVDQDIRYTSNELGFRGPSWPREPERMTKIVFVGGSTTQAVYTTDGKQWTALAAEELGKDRKDIWVNNAGLDGHSSFGHQILLQDYLLPLKPDVIAFLIGINDVGNDIANLFDARLAGSKKVWYRNLDVWLRDHTELGAMLNQAWLALRAKRQGVGHETIDFTKVPTVSEAEAATLDGEAALARHGQNWLPGYEQRVRKLVVLTRERGIRPLLITQPTMFGASIDPTSGADLGRLAFQDNGAPVSGAIKGRILEAYNDVLRKVAQEEKVPLIDLAMKLEKDSRYFYDYMHYTNDGNRRVAEIIVAGFRELGVLPKLN